MVDQNHPDYNPLGESDFGVLKGENGKFQFLVVKRPLEDALRWNSVKKSKRGACEQKAAMVLPNHTAAT